MTPALLALAAALFFRGGAVAQGAGDGARSGFQPFLGFAIGGGGFPRAFEPNCVDGWEGTSTSAAIGLRGGISRGPVGIEVRTAAQTEVGLGGAAGCLGAELTRPDGVHSVRSSPIDRGPFVMTDVRARFAIDRRTVTWLVTGGAGRVWGRDVSTLALGAGLRVGSDLRGLLDIDVSAYGIPWDETTSEWRDGVAVREIDRVGDRTWEAGVSVLIGLELLFEW